MTLVILKISTQDLRQMYHPTLVSAQNYIQWGWFLHYLLDFDIDSYDFEGSDKKKFWIVLDEFHNSK